MWVYIPVPVTIDRIRNRVNGLKTVYEGSVRNRPVVQLNSMVYNCKDQPTLPRQDSKPGTTHHYRRNEVHTHHIHGANHRYTTFKQRRQANVLLQAEKYKCLPDPSNEGEGRVPYQEQNKEKQFHTWSKDATERLLLLLLVRLHDQSSSSDEVGGLLQVLQAPI